MKRPKARNRTPARETQNGAGVNAGKTRPRASAKAAREARAERRGEPVSKGVGGGA
ncbi:MAG TPA: hypothetical protein VF624_12865 [Tepidisphaeraceae bacterium]